MSKVIKAAGYKWDVEGNVATQRGGAGLVLSVDPNNPKESLGIHTTGKRLRAPRSKEKAVRTPKLDKEVLLSFTLTRVPSALFVGYSYNPDCSCTITAQTGYTDEKGRKEVTGAKQFTIEPLEVLELAAKTPVQPEPQAV